MHHAEAPRSIQQHVSIQQVGSETLLYDERRHLAFCLNKSSSVLWRLANGQRDLQQLRAAAELELHTPLSQDFVLFALAQLRRDGLLEPAAAASIPPAASTRPAISRRALLQKLGAGSALLLPAIAAIVAPTAAQAYNGCVDCTSLSPSIQSAASASATQRARARRQQLGTSDAFDPFAPQRPYVPYAPPKSSQAPASQDTEP